MDYLFPLFGIALIVAALMQFGLWTAGSFSEIEQQRRQIEQNIRLLRAKLDRAQSARTEQPHSSCCEDELRQPAWRGFRKFRVSKLKKETAQCTSVYLRPLDEKPLGGYLPGQHLTLRLTMPDTGQPVTRCYTLSDAFRGEHYRITVKLECADEAKKQLGTASSFVNNQLRVGDLVEVKAPSGSFYLRNGSRPVVMVAGGVGITPMMSMINAIAEKQSQRQVLLIYGVRSGDEHIFGSQIEEIVSSTSNLHVITCYSNPSEQDKADRRFHIHGRVSIDILRTALPSPDFDFYLCGPPDFMEHLYDGLLQWGASKDHIRFEAFGPAPVKQVRKHETLVEPDADTNALNVQFARSNVECVWTAKEGKLLDLAEQHDVSIESGCRTGNCGTCITQLRSGRVRYDDESIQCETSWCLPCVAIPVESVVLDA